MKVVTRLAAGAVLCLSLVAVAFAVGSRVQAASNTSVYVPLAPERILDTRTGPKPTPGKVLVVPVAGRAGVPQNATAVAVNLTMTETTTPGFVTAWPLGRERGTTSVINADRAGATVANFVVVPLGEGGFNLFTQSGAHLLADVMGFYIGADAPTTPPTSAPPTTPAPPPTTVSPPTTEAPSQGTRVAIGTDYIGGETLAVGSYALGTCVYVTERVPGAQTTEWEHHQGAGATFTVEAGKIYGIGWIYGSGPGYPADGYCSLVAA